MTEFEEIKSLEDAYQIPTYAKLPIALERGRGVHVFDSEGNSYLDFYSGHAVALTGHCHPKVVKAIQDQASQLLFYSNLVYNSARARAVEALASVAPEPLKRVFLCNSGAEANETAIKMARKYTGRAFIVAMHEGFHGRTYGAMSVTGFEKYRQFPPLMPGVKFVPFGDLQALRSVFEEVNGEVAGVIMEPIQSMAGMRVAEQSVYRGIRELCDDYSAFLIFDEVQTAIGRTGRYFFGEHVGVVPDLITTAKAVASGVPMGVLFAPEFVSSTISLGEHGTTFGGGPLACAAAAATIEVIKEENLTQHAERLGEYLRELLLSAEIEGLKEVRGLGLLLGVEFSRSVKELVAPLLREGLIVGSSEDKRVLRLIPPLTITRQHCEEAVAELHAVTRRMFA